MQLKTLHRKKRKYFLLILLLCLAGITKTYAYDFSAVCSTGQTLYFNIVDANNHNVALTCPGTNSWSGFTKPVGDVVLSESVQYDGVTYTMTSIGNYAFYYCTDLTSIDIPNSVTSIETYAFGFCSGLTSIVIPNSVISIGNYSFHGCNGLNSVYIPYSVTSIGSNPFTSCNGLDQIIVDTGNSEYDSRESCNAIIKSSTNELVSGCKNTAIPNTVTSIGSNAFYSCTGLTSITIPNSMTTIGSYAFYSCTGLTSIVIPSSVTSIGINPFEGCAELVQIVVDQENPEYDSREDCNAIIKSNTNELVSGCKNTVIPNTVTSIGSYAFYSCTGLTSITIPNSVTTIRSNAFYYCTGLTSMTILAETPPPLVGNYVFYYVNKSIPMYVPCASLLAYQNTTGWNEFTNYMPATTCESGEIIVTINPTGGGTVTGTGYYDGGAICTLTATANTGYSFINWTRDGVVVSDSETYSFVVSGDASFVANFEQGVIGSGTATNVYLPSYSYFCYTLSQQIYTAEEIGSMGMINSIAFYNSGATKTRNYDVYIVSTTKNAFESTNDWITVTENNLVFSGQVTMVADAWTMFQFDTPFLYDGSSNFALVVDDNTGSWTNSPHMACRVFDAQGNQAIRVYSDSPNYDPYNPSGYTGTLYSVKNQIKLVMISLDPNDCIISTSANPIEAGTIDGGGVYHIGDTCTLTATANSAYQFVNWTKDGNIVSDNPVISFTVTENTDYVANFSPLIHPDVNNIVYVKPEGCGLNDGSSWENATGNLNLALEYSGSQANKPTIWVAAGTYYGDSISEHNAFTMVDGVNVYGGFAGNEPADYNLDLRDFEANETVLDGQNVQRVLYQEDVFATYTTWDGFTIKNGYQYTEESNVSCYGAGVYLRGKVTLSNCKIIENYACSKNYSVIGGALYASSANYSRTINITNCDISNNIIASDRTYSMWIAYCRYVNLTNCKISNNPCYGEALSAYYSIVNNCVITNNGGSNYCTGVYSYGSTISNCLVSNNSSYGISCFSSYIYNCDVVNNYYQGVVFNDTGTLRNCIVWGNSGNNQVWLYSGNGTNNTTVSYCAIEGGFSGEGNIDLSSSNDGDLFSPRFVNPSPTAGVLESYEGYSWELLEGSVCINSGDATGINLPDYDLAGNPRLLMGVIDIGCYEYNPYNDRIVYVIQSGAGSKNGSSWENACDNIHEALAIASEYNCSVWVAAGTYYGDSIAEHNAFTMIDGVNVYGGFVGNEPADYDLSLRDFETNKTILDGQNVQRVVYIESANGTLDGFTIVNGYANGGSETSSRCGGGIYLSNANNYIVKECTIVNCTANYGGGGVDVRQSVLMDCVIDNCSAGQRGGGIMAYSSEIIGCDINNCSTDNYGGGVSSDNSIVMDCVVDSCYAGQSGGGLEAYASTGTAFSTINNCVIKNCNSGNYGGGIYAMRAVISDCNITANSSDGYGGGIYTSSYGNDTIRNCIIDSNTSESLGGGMCLYKGYAYNCLVVNNHGNSTGGLYLYSGSVNNCNIVNNTSNSVGGLYNYYTGTVNNTIIWGNKKNNEISNVDVNNFSFRYTYCAIEGVPSNENGNIELASDNDGMSNLNYVRFMDIANNNFQLMPNSVCVDAGNPNYSSPDTLDLAGNSRVYNSRIDMGCYEYNGIAYIEANISDEICQGEDYLQNGFEIYYPEVGENQYSITLTSSQVIDSIVNLVLTVYPTYFFTEDTTLCNATSYTWRGNTYTESGIYYDSLQTVHGCDSIFQLSLELFNTPLGEFAGMTPTNNYPFTSLPITFSWDAVSGAEYYNLFLWNTDDSVPSMPFAGNIYNRSCYVSSLQNHQTYNWYVEAVNNCFSSTSSVRSFSLNIPPSMNVSTNSLAFGEVVLNDSVSMNMFVSGNALDDAITLQITGEDASMFSFEQGSNWNGLTGGSLTVTFSPTAVQYNYTANLVITTGTLTQTVQLTGSLADMFVFNTFVTQDVFEMNSTIPIYGTVTDVNNSPMAGAEVEVKVMVMGTTRSLFATTGDDGHFSVDFVPAYSESGYYTVNSGRVGHNSTAVHDDFNIPGMNLVTNGWILWDVVQNETATGSIVIRNRSQIPLNNIQVTANTLPDGCSFTFQPLSLAGMEEGLLEYSVSGTTPTNGYQEVTLVATSSEGASMNFTVWYRCAEPRGILYASPNNITTTMTKGINKIVDVMLYNNGTGPTGSVYLDIPSVDWLSVVGNDTLPSIAVQDSAYFSLRLSANENTPLVQHTGNIAINCERGDGLSLPYTIMAVSDSTGTLIVDVTDDYTYNGNGQHLQGATVTVKGYYSLQTVAVGLTGSDGLFTVTDIPEGYYRMSITAPHHAEYQAVILIEGGQTNTQDIYLQYQAITYSWNVVPTEIQDEYTFELIVEYETNVPVPVVVIDMPQTFPELAEGESFVFDYIITNLGLVDAYDATLYPPTDHPLYEFTPLITEIDTLHAQTSVVIPCTMTVRTGQRSPLVYAALNGRGDRDGDCPDMAKTEVWSYYYCNGEKVYVKGYKYVQIGTHPCSTPPSNGGGGGSGPGGSGGGGGGGVHFGGSGGSSTPPVTTQQQGCNDDPCQSNALDELNSCPPQFDNTPKLPPVQPGNRRNN